MADPVVGLREMKRVTTAGGSVAVSVWDHAGDRTPLAVFWQAARELDPDVHDESGLAGAREGHLAELLAAAGLTSIEERTLSASVRFASFDEWWEPFTLGIGPAGAYLQTLDGRGRAGTVLPVVSDSCRPRRSPWTPWRGQLEASPEAARARRRRDPPTSAEVGRVRPDHSITRVRQRDRRSRLRAEALGDPP